MTSQTSRHPHRSRRATAFTLIELLVVLGIIAVLIGLVFPLIGKVRRAAQGAATSAQLSTIANAIQQYHADFQAYPGPLSNIQVGYADYDANIQNAQPAPGTPSVPDPTSPNPVKLSLVINGSPQSFQDVGKITGAENLVLGLLGGLEITVLQNGKVASFDYNTSIIFPDAVSVAPKGALQLNPNKPRRWPAYLDVKTGQVSHPDFSVNRGHFTDPASRFADDTVIPEFIDQYPDGMPILYLRANVGGSAIAGVGGDDDNGARLQDTTTNQPVTPQYDLAGTIEYTRSIMGTTANNPNRDHHGLQYLGRPDLSDTIDSGYHSTSPGAGANALAYLKDPSSNPNSASGTGGGTNTHGGNARQKNGYILISPGPDRVYGTADDIIYPGTLQP
jgi:prepilin-type N-terminal cleavage/methylation domain-containing protein